MRLSTAINLQNKLYVRLCDDFSAARSYGLTSQALTFRILAHRPEKLPRWIASYLDGASRVMRDNLYRYDLNFRFVLPDGTLLDTKNMPDGWDHARICAERLPSGHFWESGKPFFVSCD